MSDVNFTIGGTAAPFKHVMKEATESAKESAEKITESFGIEGVKSERALHTRFLGAFKDITEGGKNSAEAIGGAFENLSEGLKLSLGSMIALLVFTETVKSAYEGYEAVHKLKEGIEDATKVNSTISKKTIEDLGESVEEVKEETEGESELSIKTDEAKEKVGEAKEEVEEIKMQIETPSKLDIDNAAANESVEEIAEKVKKLHEDAAASNLAAQTSLTAGWAVTIQALEEGKGIMDIVREDAENMFKLNKEAHDLEDASGAHIIANANAVLKLKTQGHDKEASALQHEQEMQEKLLVAKKKGNQETIDALTQEMALEDQLTEKANRKEEAAREAKLDDLERQVYAERMSRGNDADKLKLANEKEEHDKVAFAHTDLIGKDPVAIEQARLEWEKSITAERALQKSISDKNIEAFLKGNEKDAEQKKKQEEAAKKALELTEQKTKLLEEQKEAQQAVQAAALDATLFHGEASSLAKSGLGGRVSGANYGNQQQLKAAQDAAKHLAEINAAFKKLSGSIGVTGS